MSSVTATSTGSGGITGAESTATGAGGAGSDGTSSGGAGADDTSGGDNGSNAASVSTGGASTTTGATSSTGASTATNGPTTAGGTGGQVSVGNRTHACLEYVLGFCEFVARCSGDLDGILPCFESSSPFCPDVLFAPGSARTVDGTFACADDWRALSCELTRPECATAGTRADGEACTTSIQCASRFCSGTSESCGTCQPSAKLGEPCDYAAGLPCEPGLSCHGTDLVCVGRTDPVLGGLELGEACDPSSSDCHPHACSADESGGYTCKPYPTLGEDCSSTLRCAEDDSYCDTTLVCLALPTSGQFCGVDAASGTAERCASGLACDTLFYPPVCLAAPGAPGFGDPCEGTCQAGLTCRCSGDACDTETCHWARFEGESCSAAGEACVMGECVDGTCVVSEAASSFSEVCGG